MKERKKAPIKKENPIGVYQKYLHENIKKTTPSNDRVKYRTNNTTEYMQSEGRYWMGWLKSHSINVSKLKQKWKYSNKHFDGVMHWCWDQLKTKTKTNF